MQKTNTTPIDFAQVERFFEWIGRPVFLQDFPSRHSEIAAGKNIMAALSRLARPDSDAIFWGINPMKAGTSGVPGNADIECRRLLFLDIDHPDHDQKIPATDDGKRAACEVFRRINAYLLSRGWSAPAKIDSGNGPHGYWPIDLPNDEASAALVGDFLAACQLKFGPLVDTANKDARRLGRVPGTWNRRGDATPERPHRMCRIVDLPQQSELVTAEMIQAVIDDINTEQGKAEPEKTTAKGASGEDLRPGDDYNQRASWADILIGWKIDRTNGPVTYWTRPGKNSGTSATTGYCKGESGDLLHVFSSQAPPFKDHESYSKFAAFTLLNHNGDFRAAAKALAAQGYGMPSKAKPKKNAADSKATKIDEHVEAILAEARKTRSGKITATVVISKDGGRVDVLTLTTAAASRRGATQAIQKHSPNTPPLKIEMLIGTLLTQASDMASNARSFDGERLREIVQRIVTLDFTPAFRTPGGFFSETRGHEIRRQDLVTYTPSHLIDAAAVAIDAPRTDDGEPVRMALLKAVKTELEILYSDLVRTLPLATGANLLEYSEAAREFRNGVIRTLTTPKTWEMGKDGVTHRASLISRAAEQIRAVNGVGKTGKWKQVLNACNLWWRNVLMDDGEVCTLLAMRWELFHQIGILMPAVRNQEDFSGLGIRYGVIEKENVTEKGRHGPLTHTNHKKTRIAILKRDFIEPLLADAGEMEVDARAPPVHLNGKEAST
jgi:hypothetical protein